MLSKIDQQKYKSSIPPLDYNDPKFYWILKNQDFHTWSSSSSSEILWLSGPSKCNSHEVSSYIIDLEEKRNSGSSCSVLYFFYSTAFRMTSTIAAFASTILRQFLASSPREMRKSIAEIFLCARLEAFFTKPNPRFGKGNPPKETIEQVLDAYPNEICSALKTALTSDVDRQFSIIVDGLDEASHQNEFIREICQFLLQLQQSNSKAKGLLISQPIDGVRGAFAGIPNIEYDRERKGLLQPQVLNRLSLMSVECLATLRFANTRYSKISREVKGSLEWLWTHKQYTEWLGSDASRLLYIQGKPGSGKSTLTKYFKDHILERVPNANLATVAGFFYSYREGELQKSHYNMLQS